MNPALADWYTSEHDGRVLEQLGVHRILQFPAVGLDFNLRHHGGLTVNPPLADWHTSEHDGRVLEQLGVYRILQFPAVGLDLNLRHHG